MSCSNPAYSPSFYDSEADFDRESGPAPMTRASTVQTNVYSLLPTPQDESPVYDRKYVTSSSAYGGRHRDAERVREWRHEDDVQVYDHDGHDDSYFPRIPTPIDSHSDVLLRRRSTTKDLISRYESFNGSSQASSPRSTRKIQHLSPSYLSPARLEAPLPSVPTPTHRATPLPLPTPILELGPPLSSMKNKSRTPLRTSFRNLLNAIGVKGKEKEKQRRSKSPTTPPSTRYQQRSLPPSPSSRTCFGPRSLPPNNNDALHSGPVLYLARANLPKTCLSRSSGSLSSETGLHPVWLPQVATLHMTHILIASPPEASSFSRPNAPSSFYLSLVGCTDVRSLGSNELDAVLKALLPGAVDGTGGTGATSHYVFELQIDDGTRLERERFAVGSVAERGRWVSAIWDAVLRGTGRHSNPVRSQESIQDISSSLPEPLGSVFNDNSSIPVSTLSPKSVCSTLETMMQQNSSTLTTPAPSVLSVETRSERSHYNTSPKSKRDPVRLDVFRTPPPPSPPAFSRAHSHSPSIANLSTRSLVKTRLSELGSSPICMPSPPRLQPPSPTPTQSRLQPPPAPAHRNSVRSNADSIVASYAERDVADHAVTPTLGRKDRRNARSLHKRRPSLRPKVTEGLPSVEEDSASLALLALLRDHAVRQDGQTADIGDQIAELHDDLREISGELQGTLAEVARGMVPLERESDLRDLMSKVEEMLVALSLASAEGGRGAKSNADVSVMQNLGPSSDICHDDVVTAKASLKQLSEVHAKLDSLLALSKDMASSGNTVPIGSESLLNDITMEDRAKLTSELLELMEVLKNEQTQRATQSEQQVDSVRYLNELNTWLETFVNSSGIQMQSLITGVQSLCKEFGTTSESEEGGADGEVGGDSLLAGLRSFLTREKQRDEDATTLHSSVNALVAAVNKTQEREPLTADTLAMLIDRQRQEQEHVLRGIAAELSKEIRGERLRFVEAMKEATAINVQIHVEEFKKQLTREVLFTTQEVSRLQRERQGLEQQIADLFAFFARQKQTGHIPQEHAPQQRPQQQSQQYLQPPPLQRPRSVSHSRPLPAPGGVPMYRSIT